jgi:hypothetical protein
MTGAPGQSALLSQPGERILPEVALALAEIRDRVERLLAELLPD